MLRGPVVSLNGPLSYWQDADRQRPMRDGCLTSPVPPNQGLALGARGGIPEITPSLLPRVPFRKPCLAFDIRAAEELSKVRKAPGQFFGNSASPAPCRPPHPVRSWQRETQFLRQQLSARRIHSECRILTDEGKQHTGEQSRQQRSLIASLKGLCWCLGSFPQASAFRFPGECHSDQFGKKASEGRHGLSPTSPH